MKFRSRVSNPKVHKLIDSTFQQQEGPWRGHAPVSLASILHIHYLEIMQMHFLTTRKFKEYFSATDLFLLLGQFPKMKRKWCFYSHSSWFVIQKGAWNMSAYLVDGPVSKFCHTGNLWVKPTVSSSHFTSDNGASTSELSDPPERLSRETHPRGKARRTTVGPKELCSIRQGHRSCCLSSQEEDPAKA